METGEDDSYRPPLSPSQFNQESEEETSEGEEELNMNDDESEGSSIDLNEFEFEFDSEDSEEELIYEDKAVEFSVEESSTDEEALDDCQIYIENFAKSFQYSDEEISNFCKDKTKTQIEEELKHLEERLLKLKDVISGNFKGLDATLRDSIIHQLALQQIDKQVIKKKKRVDATLNRNTRPNRKRSHVQVEEEDDPNDFIDDEGVEEISVTPKKKVPIERVIKKVVLNESERKLADEIQKCIMEKDNEKFRGYLRMFARREMPIAVAFEVKLAYHYRNQQYERERRKIEMEAHKLLIKERLAQEDLNNQEIIEDGKKKLTFIKKQHGEYTLEYQDYVMDHQIDCLSTAINRMMKGKSLLIAHSMGLGKTLTVLLILKNYNRIYNQGKVSKSLKYLVLVPKSNIDHFSKQYAYHFPSGGFLSEIIIVNDKDNIDKLLEFDKGGRMLVMTYDRCVRILKNNAEEAAYLKKADILVIDEAHVIKNPDSERFNQFSQFEKSIKLLVTGTPLQNSISEIFTLIRFLEPDNTHVKMLRNSFNSTFTEFFRENRKKFDNREVLARTQVFYNYFKDLIHRKVNIKEMEEIAKKKEDIIIEYQMGKEERGIYKFINENYKTKCYFARYFYQRLCLDCIDYLVNRKDESDLQAFSQDYNDEDLSPESFLETLKRHIQEEYPKPPVSSRLKILKALVSQIIIEKKEKVVIFSGLVCYNKEIIEFLKKDHQINIGEFTGEISSTKRSEVINQFNRGTINTLLISKNAGGVGIDLTTATNVVLFNLDFNFAKDDQAICRLVRKNQKQKVNIFRLVCRDSVDVAVKELQAHKTVIFDQLLDDIPSIIKAPERNAFPEDLCMTTFGKKQVPLTVKKILVNIEKFQLTEGSVDLTEQEVKTAKCNIEKEMKQ